MADAITGGNDIGLWALWPANIPENVGILVEIWNRFFLTLWWKVIFKTWCSTTQKERNLSRKCTTSLIRRQNHNGEVVDRSWLCFSPSQTCVNCFNWQTDVRGYDQYAHFVVCDWKQALERLRRHEHLMEHIDATITFSRRDNWSLWRFDTELASQVNQCEQYWKSLLPETFGFCRKIYCWARSGV